MTGILNLGHKELIQEINRIPLRKKQRHIRWSDEEIAKLRAGIAAKKTSYEIGQKLGRSSYSIRRQAYNIGAKFRDDYWTEEEIQQLKTLWLSPSYSIGRISRILKRSPKALCAAAHKWGFRRDDGRWFYKNMGVAIIMRLEGYSYREIAEALKTDKISVEGKFRRLFGSNLRKLTRLGRTNSHQK